MKKKLILYFSGMIIMSLGLSLCYQINLGTDPYSVFLDGLHKTIGVSRGITLICLNIILLALIFVLDKKQIKIGLILSSFLTGIFMDLILLVVSLINFDVFSFFVKIVFFMVSIVITTFGLSLYAVSKVGAAPMDTVHFIITKKLKAKYVVVRVISDIICLALGFVLGGVVGIGTVISLLLFGCIANVFLILAKKFLAP